jgi:FkbM family methyltransferase
MIVVDVGASSGDFAVFISNLEANHRVLAIEPHPESAKKLRKFQEIEVHEIALNYDVESGLAILRVSQNPELSSIVRINPNLNSIIYADHIQASRLSHEVLVRVMSLENFMTVEEIHSIDFLKIDAQGKDWDIVLSAGDLIAKVKVLAMEVCYEKSLSLYENELDFVQIVHQLDLLGFSVVWLVPNGGGEANLLAYNRKYGYETFLRIQDELELLSAPCLKLNPQKRFSAISQIRSRFWFIERRMLKLIKR